jgi:WD40 repeat protein
MTTPSRPADAASEFATHPPSSPSAAEQTTPDRAPLLSATAPFVPGAGTPAEAPPVMSVPGYELLAELGRGGMGVVYRARQVKADRVVALKMILSGGHAGEAERARFRTEAEAIARLRHANIVQVYEVGEHDGKPFFSLEFCGGGNLKEKLSGTPLPPREAAALVEALARAMQAAHGQHVIHRDLKPANVLLAEDGTPKVTDFGLAKKLDEAGQTHSGAIMGTPSYMAPEQAGGQTSDIGPLTDVYALGAILYECLTGRPPFRAATAVDTLLQVVRDDPVPPSQLQSKTPRDLETICLKCLHKEPARRYADAAALAEDLRRFRAGEPILARPVGHLERAVKWAKRRPALAALLLVSVLAVAGLIGLSAGLAFALGGEKEARGVAEAKEKETKEALAREKEALAKQKALLSEAARTYCEWSDRDLQQGKVRDSLNWMLRAYETAPEDDPSRPSYLRLIGGQGQKLERLLLHGDAVWAVAYSPDGRSALTGSLDKTARLWDAASGKEIAALRHDAAVGAVAYSPDGRAVLTGSADGAARLWDAGSGEEIATLRHDGPVYAVAYSPDGRTVLTGSGDLRKGEARLWDAASGKELATLRHDKEVRVVTFSPDGRTALTGSADGTARLWNAASAQEIAALRHDKEVVAVAYSPDGRTVLTGSLDQRARLWDAASGEEIATLRHGGAVQAVAYSLDGRTALTGSSDGTARLWDAASGKELATLHHGGSVQAVAFSPDGRTVLAGCGEWARLWNAASGQEIAALRHDSEVRAVACSPDGRTALTGSLDKTARLWDATSGQARATLRHDSEVRAVAYSPDGGSALTGSLDKTARLWDAASGQARATLRHDSFVFAVAYSPDGRTALTGCADGKARLWDTASGQEIAALRHDHAVSAVAYSPDGRTALTGSMDMTARLWDVASGKLLHTLRHEAAVGAVVISPDGRTALTGSGKTARLWDAASGQEIATLRHDRLVRAVAYSPDGRTVLTGSGDLRKGEARLWEAASGEEIAALRHGGPVHAVAYSPDGRTVLTGSFVDCTARLWDTASGQQIAALRHHLWVQAVAFSPDGRTALTGSDDWKARLWTLPLPAPDEPARLRAWVRVRTAKCFSEQGPLRDLTEAEWLDQCRQLDALGGEWQPPPDPRVWHRHQAAEAEATKQWFAAAYHLGQLHRHAAAGAEAAALRVRRLRALTLALEAADAKPLQAAVAQRLAEKADPAEQALADDYQALDRPAHARPWWLDRDTHAALLRGLRAAEERLLLQPHGRP